MSKSQEAAITDGSSIMRQLTTTAAVHLKDWFRLVGLTLAAAEDGGPAVHGSEA